LADNSAPASGPADRPYRILALAAHPVQYMAPVLKRLGQRPEVDLTVAYCTLRAEGGYDPEFGANIRWDTPLLEGYSWLELPNRGSGRESFFGLYNPDIWKTVRSGSFDALLCFTGYRCATFWLALLAAKTSKTAFVFGTDATRLEPREGRSWKVLPKRLFWPFLFRLADQVIVPSSGSCDLMYSLGVPAKRVTLTPFSVDNEWWMAEAAKVDRAAVRAGWGISESDQVILFCAKLQTWKRPLDVLWAFQKAGLRNSHLVYAGEGPLRQVLEAEAKRLGVASAVHFLGFVNQSQLPAVYRASDVMVLSSEYEPFAVVVNEAMCCGCAVVASDRVGAARDLVAPVSADLVYPCGDVDALAQALSALLSDRQRVADVTRHALERMASWSPKQNIERTLEAVALAVRRVRPERTRKPGAGAG
jgi:glycosyltransferase involved in cell wall biosynthesis